MNLGKEVAMTMETTSNGISGRLDRTSGGAEAFADATILASAATEDGNGGVINVVWGLFVFGLQLTGDTLSVTFKGLAGASSADQAAAPTSNGSTPFEILLTAIMTTPALRDQIRDALRSNQVAKAVNVLRSELDDLRKRLSRNHEAERGEELASCYAWCTETYIRGTSDWHACVAMCDATWLKGG